MQAREAIRWVLVVALALASAVPAFAQSLRLPRGETGLDPTLARGWLAPNYDRFGFANYRFKDAAEFAPSARMSWAYALGERASLGMSYANSNYDPAAIDGRRYGLFGRYSFAPDWSLSAEAMSREPGALFRLQDFRIGVQRRF
jgi:hypothetical protein